MYSVSFTGHRPNKLPFDGEKSEGCVELKKRLREIIERHIADGAGIFFSGMALGTDTWCAEIVIELQKMHPDIKLMAVIPFRSQSVEWSVRNKARYRSILTHCEKVICISEEYSKGCMMKRNKALVDLCDVLIAVYDGKEGGTSKTLDYAKKKSKTIVLVSPR